MLRVLLVDDTEDIRIFLRRQLEAVPCNVVGEASDAAEALEAVVESSPDVVVMDLMMPDVDGIEATRRIKAAVPDVVVFAYTSVGASEAAISEMVDAGVSAAFDKLHLEQLTAAIRAQAERQSAANDSAAAPLLDDV